LDEGQQVSANSLLSLIKFKLKMEKNNLLHRYFPTPKPELLRLIIINICLAIIYSIGAQLSIKITSFNGASAIWLPSGIILAAFLSLESKVFPAIFFGSIIGLINNHTSLKSFFDVIVINLACILANYLQPFLITLLLKKIAPVKTLFNSINGVIYFLIISILLIPILPPIIIVNTAVYVGLYSSEKYWDYFFLMYASSGLAHIIFTPVFLINKISNVPGTKKLTGKMRLSSICLIVIGIMVIFWLTFIKNNSVEYIFLLLLILTVFTLGKKVSIIMVAIVSLMTIVSTALGFGPFVKASVNESLFLVQSFIGVFAITSLILSAIIDEKQKATNKLELTLANLENTVKERTSELVIAKEKAEVANQAKSTFIANMSHELRSPMNAIMGFSQLMLRTKQLPKEQYENAVIIHRSGEYLLTLINNVLDFAKIEAGKTTLNQKDFDLYCLLDELEDMLNLRAVNAGLELIFDRWENLPRYIHTDGVKLRQILLNLLSNAIKFTPQGKVILNINSIFNKNTKTYTLYFNVSDTGIGISATELKKIFEAFSQTESGREAQEGTGLGLAISRQFVQLMGGDITVESELGKGTTFKFSIQVKSGQKISDNQTETRQVLGLEPNQPTYKILTVDDKQINSKLLIRMLEPLGFEIKEASNGQEAIAIWEEWEPHLIWMDMRMPVMDGYEATKYIKSTTKGNATAVIALTASVLEEEKAIILSAGCDDFVRKPFNEQTIFDVLSKHLGVKYVHAQKNVLVLDDLSNSILTSSQLTCMPETWITQLYQAALEANTNLVLQLIGEIPETENHLMQSLTKLTRQFQFEQLVDLAEPLIINE